MLLSTIGRCINRKNKVSIKELRRLQEILFIISPSKHGMPLKNIKRQQEETTYENS